MSVGLIAKKMGMTRVYDSKGAARSVTVVVAGPNVVIQSKTVATDGYDAVQLGFEDMKEHRVSRTVVGACKKAGTAPKHYLREFHTDKDETLKPGDVLGVDRFAVGQYVDVIGVSKGKSFQGVVKRHRFGGGGAAHGSKSHRRAGAIGERSTPGRIYKNHRMSGHMGSTRRTVQNLEIVQVRPTDNVLLIAGAIPGSNGQMVIIRTAKKKPASKK
ncbi:MAG: 50S ribosomal protein L3 [Verrucomicrobiae bacterium]|nr:50S ribosomal protein L3 [Verrucomicrobiae bacterium]